MRVAAQAVLWIVWPVHAEPVFLGGVNARNVNMPHVSVALGDRNACFVIFVVEEAQVDSGGDCAKESKIRP